MASPIGKTNWVIVKTGQGYACPHGVRDDLPTHFPENSIGVVQEELEEEIKVFLPGAVMEFIVKRTDTQAVDVMATGKGYDFMICNICFVMKPDTDFAINQRDSEGNKTRRPSCNKCRLGIERRNLTSRERKEAEKYKPQPGSLWRCPICRKMGIVGVNVKVVLDHDHHTGHSRAFLCDSCNTGLGRFKNGQNFLQNAISYIQEREHAS